MTKVLKAKKFEWNEFVYLAYEEIKQKLTSTLILTFPSFFKVFEVECDSFKVDIGTVLTQEKLPIVVFSEKLNEAKRNFSTYSKESYVMVRALEH